MSRKMIGYFLISLPFIGVFFLGLHLGGIKLVLGTIGISTVIVGCIGFGVYLTAEEVPTPPEGMIESEAENM